MFRARILPWLLVLVAVAPYFLKLGATSLVDANESFYAETPREMLESGDYVNPSFNYLPRFNKPPLSYWVVGAFYRAFGVSEGVARVPIALGALVMIATAGALGWALFGRTAGLMAGVVLATSPRVLMVARRIMIDVYVSMFMTLAVACFVAAELHPERRQRWLLGMYVAMALGFLTKGPIAIVLPAVSLAVYLVLHGQVRRWRDMMVGPGAVVFVAIVLPWYAAVYWQHGWEHIVTFFLDDNLRRFAEGYGMPTPQRGVFFYVPVLFGFLFPWSTVLPIALVWRVQAWVRDRKRGSLDDSPDTRRSALATFLAIWTITVIGFFSASVSKQELYILPVLPAVSVLVGGLLGSIACRAESAYHSTTSGALLFSALILAGAGIALQYVLFAGGDLLALAGAREIALLATIGGVIVVVELARRRAMMAVAVMVLVVASAQWIFVLWTLPDFERYKPIPPLVRTIRAQAGPDARIGYYRFASPSMVFYLRQPIFEYFDERQLIDLFEAEGEIYCVIRAVDYDAIGAKLSSPTYVLDRRPMIDVRLRTLMSEDSVSDVLLVSNRTGPL